MSKTCATRNPRSTGAPVSRSASPPCPPPSWRWRPDGGPARCRSREALRNRCPATHSPAPSGTELRSGAGSDGGGDLTKTASAAQRPKGGRILVRSGGGGAGGPYAELPDGSGDQQAQPAAGGP